MQKLQADQVTALKSGQKDRLTTLRFILAQIKNKEIAAQKELTDDDVVAVLRKFVKELRESVTAFEKGGRPDLVTEYKNQLVVASEYLPAEISDEDLKKEVEKILTENRALIEKNPKVALGLCIGKLKTKAESQRIIPMVQAMTGK